MTCIYTGMKNERLWLITAKIQYPLYYSTMANTALSSSHTEALLSS